MTELAATLVGRAAELVALDDALDGLAGGRPETLFVSGEAGIGKTRLIAELLERADRRGLIGLAGRSAELERDRPYWVFVDALDEYIESLTPNALAGLADDEAAEVAQIFSALAARADGRATGYDRARTQRAVRALLECVGGGRRLVLVLDDFHWADTASIDFVGALLRRPAAGVLTVVSVRSRQVPERVVSALERAGREGLVRRLELAPLDREEGLTLLGRDDDIAAAWLAESGGNPFYLQQLARAAPAVRAPGAGTTPLAGLPVPPMVADALTEELATLGETGRTFLEGAAVAGDPFELGLAAVAAGLDEDTARDAVDALLRVELCHATDTPRRFRFRHPIVRRAVYEAAPAGWRIGAHARIAAALAAAGASPIARAHHVERSAREGDLDAVAVLCSAGEHAADRAPSAAAESYAAALRLLPASAGPERRAELLLARAVALAHAGRFDESRSELIDAIDLAPPDASVLRARLATACARIEQILGGYERAYQRLEQALESMPGPQSPEAVTLLIELALGGSYPTDWDRMRGWAERAVTAARHLGDPPLLAAALAASARADAFAGNVGPALRARDEAAGLVERIPDANLVPRVDALAHLAGAELNLDHYADCVAHAERALAIGRASGEARLFPLLFGTLGLAWRVRGELTAAIEPLDSAIESARLSGTGLVLAWGLFGRSLIALAAGDIEHARALGEESAELTRAGIQTYVAALAGFAYAAALLEKGDPGQAVNILVGRSGGSSLPFLPSAQRAMGLELLARCHLAVQDAEGATRAAEAAAAAAESVGLPLARSFARRAEAAVALAAGHAADAAGMAAEAVLAAEEVGAPIEAALARVLAGRALAASGGREAGLLELERAATALDELGAVRYRDAAEQAIRALGHTTYRRSARAPRSVDAVAAELTGRELEIGRLVVDRKKNREIADELFLSRKTVETHLRNIFFKLGINSRVELARMLERNDRS